MELKEEQIRTRKSAAAIGAALLAGAAGLAAAYASGRSAGDGMRHFYFSYLLNFCYFISISLGALFFVTLSHLVQFKWGVVVRRPAEIIAAALPIIVVLSVPVIMGMPVIYSWTNPAAAVADEQLLHKLPYLNQGFFRARAAIYFICWIILPLFFIRMSAAQDNEGGPARTLRMRRFSPLAMIIFALTVTFFSFDFIKSLDYTWHSDIFGVYFFSGCAVSGIALIIIMAALLQMRGRLHGVVTVEHYHDLGKMLFGFVFFWGYIAFSQYLLIWYTNIPEETSWYLRRQTGQWPYLALALLFGHFLLPFLGLVVGYAKRNKFLLFACAAWVLAMHWFDLYYLILPELSPAKIPVNITDLACFAGMGGIFIATISWLTGKYNLVPIKDPDIQESVNFKNSP